MLTTNNFRNTRGISVRTPVYWVKNSKNPHYPSPEENNVVFRCNSNFSMFAHFQLVSIGRKIYIISRTAMLRCDTWTGTLVPKAVTIFLREKIADVAVARKILVVCGCARSSVVEEYDPDENVC
ncbi:hypothetical protein ACS0TY_033820 [Phlomoides rotata]